MQFLLLLNYPAWCKASASAVRCTIFSKTHPHLVGEFDALLRISERLRHIAEGQVDFAEIAGVHRCIIPIFYASHDLQTCFHWPCCFHQTTKA